MHGYPQHPPQPIHPRLATKPPARSPSSSSSSLQGGHTRYPSEKAPFIQSSLSTSESLLNEKYALSNSPRSWGTPLLIGGVKEEDDDLHFVDPKRDVETDKKFTLMSWRAMSNLGCLSLVVFMILGIFVAYPAYSHFTKVALDKQGGFNYGGINGTGQVPAFVNNYGLIDRDTPESARTKRSWANPDEELELVFSDEFNEDGRTFYPGDDPYWEAVDLWYWGTVNMEWYDPSQVTTEGGSLRIRLDKVEDRSINHNLSYKGGMLQSWNKFCFTGGLIEASVQLPGSPDVGGLWPALWTMGNLGRAGYGATLEGLWPYSYDSCDVGTTKNQTFPWDKSLPVAATIDGDGNYDDVLSYLPGQRLSACTCPGESHPGPVRKDGSYVGRAAPEIDVLEAIVEDGEARISQSAQWAPFNAKYRTIRNDETIIIHEPNSTDYNEFVGGAFQQTTSGLVKTNRECYERSDPNCYAIYAFEYKQGFDDAYITWVNDNRRTWTVMQSSLAPDLETEIGTRIISREPMYIIANLGLSPSFGTVVESLLELPAVMSIDWIRVYQPSGSKNIGCDPKNAPTAKYIETYKDAYASPNFTDWETLKQPWPKSKMDFEDGKCR